MRIFTGGCYSGCINRLHYCRMQIIHKGCFSNIRAIECQKHLVQFKFWEVNKRIIKWTTNTGPGCVANVLATILV